MIVNDHSNPKFTRGEKCIFFHLVLIFVSILILLIIFLIHLYSVNHTEKSILNARRSATIDHNSIAYPPIAVVYLNVTPVVIVCNTYLLRAKWSISPANCVVARSNPDMAFWLMMWRIDYGKDSIYTTEIKNGVAHPHFDKDTLSNNIGLFKHVDALPLLQYFTSTRPNFVLWNDNNLNDLRIITSKNKDKGRIQSYEASNVKMEKCVQDLSFILDVRSYEFCIVAEDKSATLEYGALVMRREEVIGIYSWGERKLHHLPFVILNITYFGGWFSTMI